MSEINESQEEENGGGNFVTEIDVSVPNTERRIEMPVYWACRWKNMFVGANENPNMNDPSAFNENNSKLTYGSLQCHNGHSNFGENRSYNLAV